MSIDVEWLRAQPSLTGTPPLMDLAALPGDPVDLFVEWLREASHAGGSRTTRERLSRRWTPEAFPMRALSSSRT